MALPAPPPTPAAAGCAAPSGSAPHPADRRSALLPLHEHHPLRPRPESAQLSAGLPNLRHRELVHGQPYEPSSSLIAPWALVVRAARNLGHVRRSKSGPP